MAATMDDLLVALNKINAKLEYISSVLQNAQGIVIRLLTVNSTTNEVDKPDLTIPDGMAILIKAPITNSGIITVYSRRDHQNPETMIGGESFTYRIKNLSDLQIYGDTLGDFVLLTVEQK